MIKFGKKEEMVSLKAAFEAAKKARKERHLRGQKVRKALPAGHDAGIKKLNELFEAGVKNRVAQYYTGRVIPHRLRGVYSRSTQEWKNRLGEALDSHTPIITNSDEAAEIFHSECMSKDATAFAAPAPTKEVEENGYKAYKVACLFLSGDIECKDDYTSGASVTSIQVPVSRKSPYIEEFVAPYHVRTPWGRRRGLTEKRYTKAFIKVKAEGSSLGYILKSPIYRKEVVDIEGYADEEFYVLNPLDDKEVIALKAWERHPLSAVVDEKGNPLENVLVYHLMDGKDASKSSNGEVKNGVITFYCRNLPGFDWWSIANKIDFGLEEQLEKEKFPVTKPKDIAQMSTREAQSEAPAVEGRIPLQVEAYFMGIFDDARDGQTDILDEYIAKWVIERCKGRYLVLPEAVRGLAVQCRPHLTKGAATVRNAKYINHLASGHEVVYLYRDEITKEQQHQFNVSVHSKGKKGDYAGKLVVILPTRGTEHAQIEFIADLNGLKTIYNLKTITYLNALSVSEVAVSVEDEINTSIQTAATYFAADYAESRRIYDGLSAKAVRDAEEAIMSNIGKAPSIDAFSNDAVVNWSQLVSQIAPAFGRDNYYPLHKQTVEKRTEGLVNKAARLNLKSDGTYLMFVPDAGIDFGHNFLKDDGDVAEVFWAGAEKLGLREGILARFPKAHAHAYSLVRFVYAKELIERASEVLDGEELFLYKDAILHQQSGVLMCPALQSFMDRHDGADFDGDHGQLELDPEKIAILKADGKREGRRSNAFTVHITEDKDFVDMAVSMEDKGELREGFVDSIVADLAALAEFQHEAGKEDDEKETLAVFGSLTELVNSARNKDVAEEA